MRFRAERERVYETCIELADRGFLAATGGNVALRADATHFVVTPSALDYYAMKPRDACVVRFADEVRVEGDRPASVESGLHAAILRARPDCGASVHTHQPVASAYTLLSKPLEVKDRRRQELLGRFVPRVRYAPSGTAWLATCVAQVFEDGAHACLMQNHGVVVAGRDPEEAVARVAALGAACAGWFLTPDRVEAGSRRDGRDAAPEQIVVRICGRFRLTPHTRE